MHTYGTSSVTIGETFTPRSSIYGFSLISFTHLQYCTCTVISLFGHMINKSTTKFLVFICAELVQVWVLEGVRTGEHRWSCRYIVQLGRHLTRPTFAHGDHLLTQSFAGDWYGRWCYAVYRHSPGENTRKRRRGVVEISQQSQDKMIPGTICHRPCDRRTFSYVGTTEPLSAYSHALL
jgi:hypothetical protein